jgi:hypothetical protein
MSPGLKSFFGFSGVLMGNIILLHEVIDPTIHPRAIIAAMHIEISADCAII